MWRENASHGEANDRGVIIILLSPAISLDTREKITAKCLHDAMSCIQKNSSGIGATNVTFDLHIGEFDVRDWTAQPGKISVNVVTCGRPA